MLDDFWPDDLDETTATAPVVLLKEQGSLLGKKTKNLVQGRVSGIEPEKWGYPGGFFYGFNIVAPALGGYQYQIFGISHKIDFYPLRLKANEDVWKDLPSELRDKYRPSVETYLTSRLILEVPAEDDFKDLLKAIFRAPKVKRVVQSILAQSGLRRSA
ncbi:MAG: hypothetical protein HYX92_15335 [Chloroflexi bacterium]|nr:hypothetical protein [Chloroflexota bacterium]